MRQFISHLYEYRPEAKPRGVGFVKVEQDESQTVLHIHGKGLRLTGTPSVACYLFYRDKGIPRGIYQKEIRNVNPCVNHCMVYTRENTGKPEYYKEIAGVILESGDGRRFAAAWDQEPVNTEAMREWTDPLKETEEKKEVQSEKRNAELPGETKKEEEIDHYIHPAAIQSKKIQRREIAMLPRCEWHLANNSFLMHGYSNYHHLVLIDDGDFLWLGVPGIYHEQEEKAAEMFGFPRFIHIEDEEPDLEEEETEEQFGYWCRKVRGKFE